MLRNVKEMKGYTIHATDGDIGDVSDFYFDDHDWVVRYLVVDTGNWLTGWRVLIAPFAFREADWRTEKILVSLTRDQVRNSPDVDTAKPISRQHEIEFAQYYWVNRNISVDLKRETIENSPEFDPATLPAHD